MKKHKATTNTLKLNTMNTTVNGKSHTIEQKHINLTELIKLHKVQDPEMVSVQLNGSFVDRNKFVTTIIKDGDEIDFLYFMGGGQRPIR